MDKLSLLRVEKIVLEKKIRIGEIKVHEVERYNQLLEIFSVFESYIQTAALPDLETLNLNAMRVKRGLSASKAAEVIGVKEYTIRTWENGMLNSITYNEARLMLILYGYFE